jgi:hypothetical protein
MVALNPSSYVEDCIWSSFNYLLRSDSILEQERFHSTATILLYIKLTVSLRDYILINFPCGFGRVHAGHLNLNKGLLQNPGCR